jgi:predicted NBD/HSP70 family sugar kinase
VKLGLDVNESTVHAVVVNDGGQVLARADQAITGGGVGHAVRETVKRARSAARKDIASLGFATYVTENGSGAEVVSALKESLPNLAPAHVSSGVAAVIAETWCGAARGFKDVIAFAIGDHVTAGLMVGGQVFTGAHGFAGSVSWLALNPVEREDYRRFGGLEAEVAAAGIVRRLVWRIKSGDRSNIVEQVGGDLSRITADHVFQAARSGDGVSSSVIRDTAKYVGMAVSNLATVVDPEAIVLGGTLASSGDMMLEAIRVECSRRLRPPQSERVRIVLSTLGADAVAIGAARYAALPRS